MTLLGSPSSARKAGRGHSQTAAWAAMAAELDRWVASGRSASVWWRDDDAVAATPALAQILALSERHSVPLALAVIPESAEPGLADQLAGSDAPVTVIQHGYAHRNHAPAGEKKTELGDHRDMRDIAVELAKGRERLSAVFGDRYFPAMVPPWNRIGVGVKAALPSLEFRGLSTFGPRPEAGSGFLNTHVDIIDWRGDRHFAGDAACLDAVIVHLSDRRNGRCDPDEPTGLLTHHLVHDAGSWRFIDRFLAEINRHPGAVWVSPVDAFLEAGA